MSAASLYAKHHKVAYAAARGLFVPGYDQDDLDQEARLVLWKAATTWDPEHGASFPTYAWAAVRSHIIGLIEASKAQKRRALNDTAASDLETLPHLHQVSDQAEEHDDLRRLVDAILALPEFERRCVVAIASGVSYAEIGGPPKRIDNAVQRARHKLRAAA